MIAHNPLHGSGRAALPHPALALGNNAEAHEGIGMTDADGRQPPVDVASHPLPRQMMALAAALEGPPPKPADGRAEGANAAPVHGHAVVPHVPEYDRAQIGSHCRERLVQASPELGLDRLELRLPSLAHRLSQHREPSPPRLPAAMREAEKVEGLRLPVASPPSVVRREAAELDQARLVGMQRQPELREPLAQLGEELRGLLPMFESPDEVIRKAHDHHIAARLLLPPPLGPEIEYVVQVEVGQQRADAPALDRPHLTPYPLALLQHAGVQPLLDEPHDAPVRHPMLDELHQPPVVEGVEKPTDVGIEHPVHPLRRHPHRERIHGLMRTAPRPEPVREPEKVDLIDRVQNRDDGALDELVFQRGNPERPLPPVRLRDVRSPDRPGVRSAIRSGEFPLARPLPSPASAAGSSALFGGFPGTTGLSDFPRSSIIGVCPWTSRCGLRPPRPQTNAGSPGSRSRCLSTCAGSLTAQGPSAPRDIGTADVAFRLPPRRRHPGVSHGFRGSIPGPYLPLSTLRGRPYERLRMTRGRRGSLRLRRMTPSFTAPRRCDRRTEDAMNRIVHLALKVEDLEKTTEFYH